MLGSDRVRSWVRPPSRGSIAICRPDSPLAVWSAGHHVVILSVHTENACSIGHRATKAMRTAGRVAASVTHESP